MRTPAPASAPDLRLRHEAPVTITVIGAASPVCRPPRCLGGGQGRLRHPGPGTHGGQHLLQRPAVKPAALILENLQVKFPFIITEREKYLSSHTKDSIL